MMDSLALYIGIYLAVVSVWAVVLTVYDKHVAGRGSRRVSERTLLLAATLGGSIAMFTIMRLVRHKTKHAKFMIGIPVIIILQIAAVLGVRWFAKGGAI